MNQRPGFFAVISTLAIALAAAPSFAQTPAEYAQTAAFAAAHQNKDGGFATKVGGKSAWARPTQASGSCCTSGGSIPDVLGCVKLRQVLPRLERRLCRGAGRQARSDHHGHRLDGRLRAQDRRP